MCPSLASSPHSSMPRRPPSSTLFPYTTLFRSLMSESVIGLLLGTEEDWPAAFEALVSRLGPVDGTELRTERIINERSEEHTSELQSPVHLVCRRLLEKKK